MIHKKIILVFFIFFFAAGLTGLTIRPCPAAGNLKPGIVLADDRGNILYGQNREKNFVPASILKILTSLAAFHILGQDYRFPTAWFFDEPSEDLYIKGFGDPLFLSEVIQQLCCDIGLKTKKIHHIILNQTYFSNQIQVPGKGRSLNPYDAPVGALCANFNTIMFKWNPIEGGFVSAEPQTPLLSIFHEDIKKTRLKQGRIVLSEQQRILYPGFLMKYFFEKNHILVTGSVLQGPFKALEGEGVFLSPFDTKEIVQNLLKYSNNFMANQLLLAMGAKTYGPPATLEKGVKAIQLFSRQVLKFEHLTLSEGSGLSRSNLISPDQMIKVLIAFMPFHSLLNSQGSEFFKTGTLAGIRTRAGYISGKNKRLYPYVIMVNQKNKGYDSIRKDLLNRVLASGAP